MGNLTRDPELKYTPKGSAIANVGIAINRTWVTENGEKREEVTFVDVEFWGKVAEVIGEHFRKGKPIFIEGRLKLDMWDDQQTGQKRSKMKVVAESFQFLTSKDKEEEPEGSPRSTSVDSEAIRRGKEAAGKAMAKPPQRPAPPTDIEAEDLPF